MCNHCNELEYVSPNAAKTGSVAKAFVKTHGEGGASCYFVLMQRKAKPPLEFYYRRPHFLSMHV